MKAARYGRFSVNVFFNGQMRQAILHVVAIENESPNHLFLFDMNGFAVDDIDALAQARHQYATGIAAEIEF